ncbi:DinB family protein [Anaerobacillus isosaccharinicus]|uniref:DinB family protein n=1 Tax=Anaerobacillus isosaccharinicus TaxID=1532552 RepID=A0A1S2LJM8_9BACI|nr:DinB family protein [Anaerobacillus isosaccharinicus]MBA5587562.1 DinB family protein [Anaerobacillus isosaccharinicus]QOY34261.1 DinB family protein [Anaerobacillus isosaccharinicus]
MAHFIFTQLDFIRKNTLKAFEDINEEKADYIPKGFKNNIRWHLGHLYVVQEKLAFTPLDLPMELPTEMLAFFAPGTAPEDWKTAPPTMEEIKTLLEKQIDRVYEALQDRLHEQVNHPFTTKSGLTLETVEQFLSFNLYHEGVHVSTIKALKALSELEDSR